jgi:co-chaperonin GroES (HSP10)
VKIQRENRKTKGETPQGKFTAQYPLLVERAKEYGYQIPTFQPRGSNVVVWRLPPIETTPGGLHIIADEQSPHVKGVLVAAGPVALDSFESEGITLGQIVIFKRFAGWEVNDQTPEALRACRILMISASDVIGSDDLREELESGRARLIKGDDGRHRLQTGLLAGKKAKVLALAAHPSATPGEKAAAQAIAAKMK